MRELKFRAWDKEGKQMLQVDAIALAENAFEWGPGVTDEHNDFHPMADVELMQFTGLTDRNGVEIYEGDIADVTVFDTFAPRCSVVWHDGEGSMWSAGWVFKRHDTSKFESVCAEGGTVDYAVVIGNVHEHAHLLEQPQPTVTDATVK